MLVKLGQHIFCQAGKPDQLHRDAVTVIGVKQLDHVFQIGNQFGARLADCCNSGTDLGNFSVDGGNDLVDRIRLVKLLVK